MVIRVRQAPPGFGLVEMLVVVAILSVLAIGTSMLTLRNGGELPQTVDILLADAIEARRLAMFSGLDHALVFGTDGWQVSRRSEDDWTSMIARQTDRVTLTTSQSLWVLSADGGVATLDLGLTAGGDGLRCQAGPAQMLGCR